MEVLGELHKKAKPEDFKIRDLVYPADQRRWVPRSK